MKYVDVRPGDLWIESDKEVVSAVWMAIEARYENIKHRASHDLFFITWYKIYINEQLWADQGQIFTERALCREVIRKSVQLLREGKNINE